MVVHPELAHKHLHTDTITKPSQQLQITTQSNHIQHSIQTHPTNLPMYPAAQLRFQRHTLPAQAEHTQQPNHIHNSLQQLLPAAAPDQLT